MVSDGQRAEQPQALAMGWGMGLGLPGFLHGPDILFTICHVRPRKATWHLRQSVSCVVLREAPGSSRDGCCLT